VVDDYIPAVITARLFQPGGHTREMTGITGCDRP
jgi:hypothetical protein